MVESVANAGSWAEMVQAIDKERKRLPWNPIEAEPVVRTDLVEVRILLRFVFAFENFSYIVVILDSFVFCVPVSFVTSVNDVHVHVISMHYSAVKRSGNLIQLQCNSETHYEKRNTWTQEPVKRWNAL